MSLLHLAPTGLTTPADAEGTQPGVLVDAALAVGALLVEGTSAGYTFPGSEGPITCQGDVFPDGQLRGWRRRYHPVADGRLQRYQVGIRIGTGESFPEMVRASWRWAFHEFSPAVAAQNIAATRTALFDQLAGTVARQHERVGIPLLFESTTGRPFPMTAAGTRRWVSPVPTPTPPGT